VNPKNASSMKQGSRVLKGEDRKAGSQTTDTVKNEAVASFIKPSKQKVLYGRKAQERVCVKMTMCT
jgi:hypothetical protein